MKIDILFFDVLPCLMIAGLVIGYGVEIFSII